LTGNDPSGTSFRVINGLAFVQPPNFEGPPTNDVNDPAYRAYYSDPLRFFGTAPPVTSERVFPFLSENFSILKKTRLTETVILELRGEFFNLFNRHRYFGPDTNFNNFDINNPLATGGFGISGVVGDPNVYGPRTVQVGAKLIF
jgi:hypothetical protein